MSTSLSTPTLILHFEDAARQTATTLGLVAAHYDTMMDSEREHRGSIQGIGVVGVVIALIAVTAATGWIDWPGIVQWVRPRAAVASMFALSAVMVATAATRQSRRVRHRASPVLGWRVVAVAAVIVVAVAWGTTSALLGEGSHAKDPAAARIDAIKSGLSIGAGTGGLFALLLAVRRQWHQELIATDTALDAEARRIAELYAKAVEQLGSDKAHVRLGGLYALERLAQDNPTQRQTIVNVLCAYLRMPYELPGTPPDADADEKTETQFQQRTQERQVRLTAQSVLTIHLYPGSYPDSPIDTYWPNINLDVAGAALIEFNLDRCHLRAARFDGARFIGPAHFNSVRFDDNVWFTDAQFAGDAWFNNAAFSVNAEADRASFDRAQLDRAQFAGRALFGGDESFGVHFPCNTRFNGVQFAGNANFCNAWFAGSAQFENAQFTSYATFHGARFTGGTRFANAKFAKTSRFEDAQFAVSTEFQGARFTGNAHFTGARFADVISFSRVWFVGDAQFKDAQFASYGIPFARMSDFPSEIDDPWIRLDVPDYVVSSRTWPAGLAVRCTSQRPDETTEGTWGRLVESD